MGLLLKAIGLSLLLSVSSQAHPVAQGAVDATVWPDRIHLEARVSTEEVLVQNAFSSGDRPVPWNLARLKHAEYFLQHFRVLVDGNPIRGRLIQPPPDGAGKDTGFVTYGFEYPFSAPVRPTKIVFQENILREFDFAPGNPWEATFVMRIRMGEQIRAEGLLLSAESPVDYTCDWTPVAQGRAPLGMNQRRMFQDYLRHGIHHILQGYDHLLFMTALVLAAITLMDLIKVVTAFTLAHTITLTLSVLGWVRLPSSLVEPLIAGSIVFVAVQNIFWPERTRGWQRLAVAFFFGLFHGLGFAGGLLQAMEGMSGSAIATAIIAFSIGVEIGHQMVVLPIFGTLFAVRFIQKDRLRKSKVSRQALRYGSILISLAGFVYLVAALRS